VKNGNELISGGQKEDWPGIAGQLEEFKFMPLKRSNFGSDGMRLVRDFFPAATLKSPRKI